MAEAGLVIVIAISPAIPARRNHFGIGSTDSESREKGAPLRAAPPSALDPYRYFLSDYQQKKPLEYHALPVSM
jgi:hypothetical protein